MEWTYIEKNHKLPDDFISEDRSYDYYNLINHKKYVIEIGNKKEDWWMDEYVGGLTVEVIGVKILGLSIYRDIRYRLRTDNDETFSNDKYNIFKRSNI